MMKLRAYPTYDEILAIEHAARRAQAEEIGRLAVLGASRLKALALQFAGVVSSALDQSPALATRRGSGNSQRRTALASVMEELCASLPPQVRVLYAEDLAVATRVAGAIDFCIAIWDFTVGILAGVFHGLAGGLRAGAWCFEVAARRLTPLH